MKIDVTGSIDKIKCVSLPVFGGVTQPHRLRLNRNSPFPLQLELVEELLLHLALFKRFRKLQDPIGKGRLPVVDMGNDAEITDIFSRHGAELRIVKLPQGRAGRPLNS
jgi:hypothetical protein